MWQVTVALFVVVMTLLILFYKKRRKDLSLFKKMGIPGPEPHWLYGNLHELQKHGFHTMLQKWTKQYKKMYGYYEACKPVLVISDLDTVQEVFVKKYSSFHGRKELFFPVPEKSDFNHMFTAYGPRWKRLRTIINPTFSSLKLKQMLPIMEEKINTLVKKVAEAAKEEKPVNMMKLYQGFTLDVITDAAFGLQVDSLNNPNEHFLVNCRKVFDSLALSKRSLVLRFGQLVPEAGKYLWYIFRLVMKVMKLPQLEILQTMGNVIELREKEKVKRTDLLQLMLDVKVDDIDDVKDEQLMMTSDDDRRAHEETAPSQASNENLTPGSAPKPEHGSRSSKKKLTIQEIKSQSFLFLIAGYETTSTALSYCTYLLSKNPEVQHKLLDEIDHYLPQGTKVTYEIIQQMTYLHMVLCESLRMYPLASDVVNRRCFEACTVGGVDIPEGMNIQVDMWSVHYDPEVWGADPDCFVPERFSKEAVASRHPMAWMPFGLGPRNCVGLRFALLEAKLALAEILRRYAFEKCDATEEILELQETGVIIPKNGVQVKLVPRQHHQ